MLRITALSFSLVLVMLAQIEAGNAAGAGAEGVSALDRSQAVADAADGGPDMQIRALKLRADASALSLGRVPPRPMARMGRQVESGLSSEAIAGDRRASGLFTSQRARPGRTPPLSVPLNETLWLGVRYRFLTGEDLRFEVAETGSLGTDYASHNFVISAGWQF